MTEPSTGPDETTPSPDEGQGDPFDPVQEGAPATGPEAPMPPGTTEEPVE